MGREAMQRYRVERLRALRDRIRELEADVERLQGVQLEARALLSKVRAEHNGWDAWCDTFKVRVMRFLGWARDVGTIRTLEGDTRDKFGWMFTTAMRDEPWPEAGPYRPCAVCGKPWRPFYGSHLPCHARCLWTSAGARELIQTDRSAPELAAMIGVTNSIVRAGIRKGYDERGGANDAT